MYLGREGEEGKWISGWAGVEGGEERKRGGGKVRLICMRRISQQTHHV